MKTLTLFYRDGDNYKCTWDVQVEDAVVDDIPNLPVWDGKHDLHELGLDPEEIPLIQEHGYDDSVDHSFVTIEAIDGVPTEWSEE